MGASGHRLDLHSHTFFSRDGVMSPAALLTAARERGLSCIAITDHDTIRGALQGVALAESDPSLPRVIPGVELSTRGGEIIGFYVSEEIPSRLTVEEAVLRIRGQGGLACLPHPYDVLRHGTISKRELLHAAELVDVIEAANGRSLGPRGTRKADALARRLGKPRAAGSDAHRRAEVGSAYVTVGAVPTRDTLVHLLEAGSLERGPTAAGFLRNWVYRALSPMTRVRRRLEGLRLWQRGPRTGDRR